MTLMCVAYKEDVFAPVSIFAEILSTPKSGSEIHSRHPRRASGFLARFLRVLFFVFSTDIRDIVEVLGVRYTCTRPFKNGAGENRTPVPKQSTIHVYASSQVFNFGDVGVHLTNSNAPQQTKFLIPPRLASTLEPARILHTALYQASRTVCRRLCCECVVSVAN